MRADRELGHKLGPRLVDLAVQATVATRHKLAPHEARVRAAGTQMVIDRMGEELAEVMDPVMRRLIERGDMPDDLAAMIGKAASGKHQWQSTAMTLLGASGATSALGTVLSNYLTPVVAGLVEESPHLIPDIGTVAQLGARGWITENDVTNNANKLGYNSAWALAMMNAAMAWPDPGTITQLFQRGHLGGQYAEQLMKQVGVPGGVRSLVLELAKAVVSPADAALAVLRGSIDHERALAIASQSGYNSEQFALLIDNTGEPLGLMQLLEAYRRGVIGRERLVRGIRQSRVRDEWVDVAEALRYEPMSVADAADAALRGHLTETEAQAIAQENGLTPRDWAPFYANQGNPLAPEQLLQLWRRGKISESRVRKGLREGRTRDEWIGDALQLRDQRMGSADALDAWLRGHLTREAAQDILAANGLAAEDFTAAFGNAGNPLALEQLLEAFRRGFIDQARFERGFRESRYRDEWAGVALQLRYSPMSTAEAVQASVQGHIGKDQAAAIAQENGLAPADFEALWQTAGEPLSRTELEQLFNRGLVSRAFVEQGLRESRLKDKYVPAAVDLHVRLPTEQMITRMQAAGVLDPLTAVTWLMDLGYAADVAATIVQEGVVTGHGQHRQLMASQVTALYEDGLIGQDQALAYLAQLRYDDSTAQLVIELADYTRHQRILQSGVTAVRNHYLHYLADEDATRADLSSLNIPPDAASLYLQVWDIERKGATRTLTEPQIVKAWKGGLFDQDPDTNTGVALARLSQLGYSDDDAQLLLAGA